MKRAHAVSGAVALMTITLATIVHGNFFCLLPAVFYALLFWNAVIDCYTHQLFIWLSNCALGIALAFHLWHHWADINWWIDAGLLALCIGGAVVGFRCQ